MCGIFGVFPGNVKNYTLNNLLKDISTISNLSSARGSDTFGISFFSKNRIYTYKSFKNPKKTIKCEIFKDRVFKNINNDILKSISFMGQTRLVTTGSKFVYDNNQPIVTNGVLGVHNGIFFNEKIFKKYKKINFEDYNQKSDSLTFFEELGKFKKNTFVNSYIDLLKKKKGNYSIAFRHINDDKIYVSSNTGSIYYLYDKNNGFYFASEKKILNDFIKKSYLEISQDRIIQVKNFTLIYDLKNKNLDKIIHNNKLLKNSYKVVSNKRINHLTNLEEDNKRFLRLKRCRKCILPETYPLISFDKNGVCNFCINYQKQKFKGKSELEKILKKFRSKSNDNDCIVGLSGGRDSSYGLHLLKKKLKMKPIAYTYDWGLTTDISRINASKICGELGVEHIIRAADIEKKRKYIKLNIESWLKRPKLGMLPIIQAGDKSFIDYGRILAKELNLKLVIHFTGYQLEQREFFIGFTGINQKLKNNQRMTSYSIMTKIKLFFWYSKEFLLNPSYFNAALFDNFNGFISSFFKPNNLLHFFEFLPWNETEIEKTLKKNYSWNEDAAYGKNQWRMGDGQTAFNNFIYYTMCGFSEYDNFRSNQIREGLISRKQAIALCKKDNQIRYDALKNFSEIIGFNLDNVICKIKSFKKLY